MNAALNPITRRALSVRYRSPITCPPYEDVLSGSSTGTAELFIDSFECLNGPNLLSADVLGDQITLTWELTPGAYDFHIVYRATSEDGTYSIVQSGVVGTTFTDTGLTPGIYYYKVVSLEDNCGATHPSNIKSGTVV